MTEKDLQVVGQQQHSQDFANVPEEVPIEETYQITVKLPSGKLGEIKILASPRESIHDVKRSLMESPETCAQSCFFLTFNGKRINDYMELGKIQDIATESEFILVEENYTERDVRLHINRLRDLLAGPYNPNASSIGIDPSLSFFTAVTGEIDEENVAAEDKTTVDMLSTEPILDHAFTDINIETPSKLSDFVPSSFQRTPPLCLKSISLSGWNPVPHSRRLVGDLIYLTVVTLENETLSITAATTGFFINNSSPTEFNPHPRDGRKKQAHSLIHLLQSISPQFATNFTNLQDFITARNMFEVVPLTNCFPCYPWAVQPTQPTFDLARPAEPYLNYGTDVVGPSRDWNDELQSNRELPMSNLQECVLREQLIAKVQSEFADAAVRGAMAVITGSVVPLNPFDSEDSHMHVYNNIFFTRSNNSRGTCDTLGGADALHVAIGKDFEGVKTLNNMDINGLYTLGTVVVDYKGIRIMAQSIVPGILRRQDENLVVYGSTDNGSTIMADKVFHEKIAKDVARPLHLAEHALVDGIGGSTKLHTSLETKGLLGADGRRYLLDLYRLCPVDIEFQDSECVASDDSPAYPHKMTLLRPELIHMYWEHMFKQWYEKKLDSTLKKHGEAAKSITNQDEGGENDTTDSQQQQQQYPDEENTGIDTNEFQLSFNPDVFTDANLGDDDQVKTQEQLVRGASKFLNDEIIPALVSNFASFTSCPSDGEGLTQAMHSRGINMRYLGKVAKMVSLNDDRRMNHVYALVVQEMVVRVNKQLLRQYTATLDLEESRLCLSHYLNCLLGGSVNAKPSPVLPPGKNKNDYSWTHLSPPSLKKLVKHQVLVRFRYSLTDDDWSQLKPILILRDTCNRTGIQLEARDYRFAPYTPEELAANAAADAHLESVISRQHSQQQKSSRKTKKRQQAMESLVATPRRKTTFIPDDIMNILPVVKQPLLRSANAEETFEAGKMSLEQGQREIGLELLWESLSLHEQIYGCVHPETSKCYAALAMIAHNDEEREIALELQRKAVIASERTLGVDHTATLHHYLNLGLFEHAVGRSKLALRYVRHALYYWDLLLGTGHPESATADINAGVMLQSLRDHKTAIKFFERACSTQENIFGKDHVLTASCYHLLTKSYTFLGKFDKALSSERFAYGIFDKMLGKDNPRTKESDACLKELTLNDLSMQQKQEQQATHTSAKGKQNATKNADITQDELSIDQVLQYINNGSTVSSRKNGKKSTQKRR